MLFKLMRVPDANGLDKVEAMKQTYYKLCLDCLVILGGNGTQKTANLLREEGLNIIHLPKTIDNDIWGTDMTFGFQSAVNIATTFSMSYGISGIGAGAAEAILDGEYGIMIGIVNGKIKRVPLEECAGKLKMVSPKDQTVKAAKQIGISFGD